MKFSELQEKLASQSIMQSNLSKHWIGQMCILNMGNFSKGDPIGFCFVDSNFQISDCTHTEHSSGMTYIYKD